MWIIAGLGNPGRRYENTRHNIGYTVLGLLSVRHGIELKEKDNYRIGRGSIGGNNVVLIEPLTYMNRSGIALSEAVKKHNISHENIIVIHDDIDMGSGRLKIRKRGSSGGHRGIESIIESIGTRGFIRIKVGVGRGEDVAVEDYVLSRFRKEEMQAIKEAVVRAADAAEEIIKNGADKAMNKFNR